MTRLVNMWSAILSSMQFVEQFKALSSIQLLLLSLWMIGVVLARFIGLLLGIPVSFLVRILRPQLVSDCDATESALSGDKNKPPTTEEASLSPILAPSSRSVKKYYAVRRGLHPGIYNSWAECSKEVSGFSGAKFKGFKSRVEAEKFLMQQDN